VDSLRFAEFFSKTCVGIAIYGVEAGYQRLWPELHPSIVAVDHEDQVLVLSRLECCEVRVYTGDFGEVRSTGDIAVVIEGLIPINHNGCWVAQDAGREENFAEVWVRVGSRDDQMKRCRFGW
jgi:hypothetical protein